MRPTRFALITALALATAACATSEEWAEWKSHTSHFASGSHGFFSIRNREGSATRVTRADVAQARDQGWWGKAITVEQEQILERAEARCDGLEDRVLRIEWRLLRDERQTKLRAPPHRAAVRLRPAAQGPAPARSRAGSSPTGLSPASRARPRARSG